MSQMRNRFAALIAISAVFLNVGVAVAQERVDAARPAYLNPALPLQQRVDYLVSRMTIEEKCSQLVHQAAAIPRLQVPAYNWRSEANRIGWNSQAICRDTSNVRTWNEFSSGACDCHPWRFAVHEKWQTWTRGGILSRNES
jgi:hypothetical protein